MRAKNVMMAMLYKNEAKIIFLYLFTSIIIT